MLARVLAVVLTWLLTTFLVFRLSAFRKDRTTTGFFGEPFPSMQHILSLDRYRDEGQWMVPALLLMLLLLALSVIVLLGEIAVRIS